MATERRWQKLLLGALVVVLLLIAVVARGVDDVNQFIANLDATGAFIKLRPDEERMNERGEFESIFETTYQPSVKPPPPPRGRR